MRGWLFVFLVLLLPACSANTVADATPPPPTELPATPTLEPTPTVIPVRWDPSPEATVVLITRCGGEWDPCSQEGYVPEAQIWGDGHMRLAHNTGTSDPQLQDLSLTPQEMENLLHQIAGVGFFAWEEYYAAEEVTDASTRCIAITLVGDAHSVCERHSGAPPAFRAIYDHVTRWRAYHVEPAVLEQYLAALALLPPTDVVLEYEVHFEPNAEVERFESASVTHLRLLAGGEVVYLEEADCIEDQCAEQLMRAQLTPLETASLLELVRRLDFEQLQSHTDPCFTFEDGSQECLIGGGQATIRLLFPSGTVRELNFSDIAFAQFPNLEAIRLLLVDYRHLTAAAASP